MDTINKKSTNPLTLNPDEQPVASVDLNKTPQVKTMQMPAMSKVYSAGSIEENMLSEEEKEMIEQFASEIDVTDVKQVLSYGAAAQRNISDFSVTILNKVKTRDLGEVGDALKELTVSLNATTEPEKKGIAGWFQKGKRGIEAIKANYAKAETNVQKIERDLQSHQIVLMQDISMFEQMYDLNLGNYRELTMYIIAGKKALDKAKGETLEYFREKAERTGLQEDLQAFNDYQNMCNRFEKKLHDLEMTRTITIQSAPQIRLVQNNDEEMLEKIQSSLINTIPLWRNQMVLALGIEHSRRAVSAQNAVSETTNNLLTMNAAMLKQATVETAKEAERSIVDIDTLKRCNRELITTINDVVKIHEEGSRRRVTAHEELVKIENELKQAMLTAATRK